MLDTYTHGDLLTDLHYARVAHRDLLPYYTDLRKMAEGETDHLHIICDERGERTVSCDAILACCVAR